jgi:hypothetical protein
MVIVPLYLVQLSTEDRGEHQLNIIAHRKFHLAVRSVYYIKSKHNRSHLHLHARRTTPCNDCDRTVVHHLGTFDMETVDLVILLPSLKTPLHLLYDISLVAFALNIFEIHNSSLNV